MSAVKPLPLDVWKTACGAAEAAVRIAPAYEGRSIYFFPATKSFCVEDNDAGVAQLAHKFLEIAIVTEFTINHAKIYLEMIGQADIYSDSDKKGMH